MSFPKYPEYKDSGVEWLGEVPAHWEVPRLKHLARIRNGRDYKDVEVESGGYPVIGSGGEFSRANNYLYKGESVLLGRKGTIDKPLYINGPFWTVDTMFYTELSSRVNGRFLFYYATCFRFDQYSTNTALPSMAQEDLANIQLAAPEPDEQAHIATFLDHETARIDALVEEQKRLIELLKEKRQAVISDAVTKGLDPDVSMKDSGVEWLGEVPEHWAVTKVAYHYEVVLGKMLDERRIAGKHLAPYLRNTDVQWDRINIEGLPLMDFSPTDRKKYELVDGDLLVCEGGEVGRAAIWEGQKTECFYQKALHRMRPLHKKSEIPRFMFYLLRHASEQGRFTSMEGKSTIAHLPAETLRQYQFPFPPKSEQEMIVGYLDRTSREMNKLVDKAEIAIRLLNERRSALISAAATGKIDVRGWQPPAGSSVTATTTQTEMV
ncbi:MAG: restriction endonuclease subunit S [Pseudomonadota bacterium]